LQIQIPEPWSSNLSISKPFNFFAGCYCVFEVCQLVVDFYKF
jgi:hypothetical protein